MTKVRWMRPVEGVLLSLPTAGEIVVGEEALLPDHEASAAVELGLAERVTEAEPKRRGKLHAVEAPIAGGKE